MHRRFSAAALVQFVLYGFGAGLVGEGREGNGRGKGQRGNGGTQRNSVRTQKPVPPSNTFLLFVFRGEEEEMKAETEELGEEVGVVISCPDLADDDFGPDDDVRIPEES